MATSNDALIGVRDKALKEAMVDLEEALRQLAILRGLTTAKGQERYVDEIEKLVNRALYAVDRIYSEDYLYEPRGTEEVQLDLFDPYAKAEELDFEKDRNWDLEEYLEEHYLEDDDET